MLRFQNKEYTVGWKRLDYPLLTFASVLFVIICKCPLTEAVNVEVQNEISDQSTSKLHKTINSDTSNQPVGHDSPTTQSNFTYPTCKLEVKSDMVKKIQQIFPNKDLLVFIRLNFGNISVTLETTKYTVVDPLLWILVEKSLSSLLSYPKNFEKFSLGSLSKRVNHINISMDSSYDKCLLTTPPQKRIFILADLLNEIGELTTNTSKGNFKVCLETVDCHWASLEVNSSTIPRGNDCVVSRKYVNRCFSANSSVEEDNEFEILYWLKYVVAASYFGACFFPLGLYLLTTNKPPLQAKNKYFLSIDTDLPVGFKYWFCHNGIVGVICVLVIIYSLSFAACLLKTCDKHFFPRGWSFAPYFELSLLSPWVCVVLINVVLLIYLPGKSVTSYIDDIVRQEQNTLIHFDRFTKIRVLERKILIPVLRGSVYNKFSQICLHHFLMIFNPNVVGKWFSEFNQSCLRYLLSPIVFLFLAILKLPLCWLMGCTYKKYRYQPIIPVISLICFIVTVWVLSQLTFITMFTLLGLFSNYASFAKLISVMPCAWTLAIFRDIYGKYCTLLRLLFTEAQKIKNKEYLSNGQNVMPPSINENLCSCRSLIHDSFQWILKAAFLPGLCHGFWFISIPIWVYFLNSLEQITIMDIVCLSVNVILPLLIITISSNAPVTPENAAENQEPRYEPKSCYIVDIDYIPHISLELFKSCIDEIQPLYIEVLRQIVYTTFKFVVVYLIFVLVSIVKDDSQAALEAAFPFISSFFALCKWNLCTSTSQKTNEDIATSEKIKAFLKKMINDRKE